MNEPFLKWPGGKRWLVQRYAALFPRSFRTYYEPFIGSGAVFFHLAPKVAVLSDSNAELVNAYQCIRDDPVAIDVGLRNLHARHSSVQYYEMRARKPRTPIGRAVRFIYLNRTCFNGIYRVNRLGEFNVPIGSKDLVEYPDGYVETISKALRHSSIEVADFEKTIDEATQLDFVYVDPPYTVMHNNNNFIKYNAHLFSWDDQVRLSSALRRAARRGVIIMLSNADHESLRTLYCDFGFHHHVTRSSVLAGRSECRRVTSELVITNYNPQ